MLETRDVEINTESSKNEIVDNSPSINTTLNSIITNNKSEVVTIKPKVQSKFELYLIDAYKKLISFADQKEEPKKLDKKALKEKKAQLEEEEKIKVQECETELRKAIEEIESSQDIFMKKIY